jgi:hypothetical protein
MWQHGNVCIVARVVGPNVVLGTIALVEKNLIRVAKLSVTTSTRGSEWPLLPNEEVPSHADEMRRMDCRGFEVLYFTSDRLGSGIIITRYR